MRMTEQGPVEVVTMGSVGDTMMVTPRAATLQGGDDAQAAYRMAGVLLGVGIGAVVGGTVGAVTGGRFWRGALSGGTVPLVGLAVGAIFGNR